MLDSLAVVPSLLYGKTIGLQQLRGQLLRLWMSVFHAMQRDKVFQALGHHYECGNQISGRMLRPYYRLHL